MGERTVRIGGACGAWGDSPMGLRQLLGAGVDYVMMDFLAEVTMSLLARARSKDPEGGYPPDFVRYVAELLPELAGSGARIVTNAGGVHPCGVKAALDAACAEAGVPLDVAVVEGDDVLPLADELRAGGEPLPEGMLTANAYLGARPIAAALAGGADVVVTGRCADSALALGILMHEFGWRAGDYDALAAGSLVGHLLECGPQATGGTFTDWHLVPGWDRIGYPFADVAADGTFVVGKPDGTGGLVSPACLAEQLLYEVGDPAAYLLPDVTADFSRVRLEADGPDRVRVSGARGRPPTPTYKVSATYQDGYRATALVSIVGPDAAAKARRTAEALVARGSALLADAALPGFAAVHVDVLGAESAYGARSRAGDVREVVLRLVVDHADARALRLFARELGSVGLGMAPGTTGIMGGRPRPVPVVRLHTFHVAKDRMPAPVVITHDGQVHPVDVSRPGSASPAAPVPVHPPVDPVPEGPAVQVPLRELAYARSGDKGDTANIAVIAREPEYVPVLRRELTAAVVAAHFAEQVDGDVVRYEAPGVGAFNFVLDRALGGGGMASRRIDPQGKAYGQMLLELAVPVPEPLLGQ